MARGTSLIPERGDVLVVIHELAQNAHSLISIALNDGWITCVGDRPECLPLAEGFIFYAANFPENAVYLLRQIGRQDAGRIRVVERRWRRLGCRGSLILRRYGHAFRGDEQCDDGCDENRR